MEDEIVGPFGLLAQPIVRHPGVAEMLRQRLNWLDEVAQDFDVVGTSLGVEELLGEGNVRDGEQQIALVLERDASLAELLIQPLSAVHADANRVGEIALDAGVAQAEFGVLKVVVIMQALAHFLDRIDPAFAILAESIGEARFDAGEQSDTSGGSGEGRGAGQFECGGFLVNLGTIEMFQRDALFLGELFGLSAQRVRELLAVLGKIDVTDLLTVEVGSDAAFVAEQAGVAAKAQSIESREDEADQAAETR